MHTQLCPGGECEKRSTCLRAIRYQLEPSAPMRSETILDRRFMNGRGEIEPCSYYFEDNGKRASREPNQANLIGAYVNDRWPALKQFNHLWVTGSTVWRVAYSMEQSTDADLDVFVCDDNQYLTVCKFLHDIETPAPADKPKRRGSNEGERIYTTRGWVDVWIPRPVNVEDGAVALVTNDAIGPRPVYDPFHALRQYPPSTHGHCRIAYSPFSNALITIANEYASDDGALEMHERAAQWHIAQADRLYQLAKRSA